MGLVECGALAPLCRVGTATFLPTSAAQVIPIMAECDIPIEKIKPESRLFEELDIDSIDAVDLLVRMKPMVGKRMQPDAFKAVRTVQDVVDALHLLIHDTTSPPPS